MVMARALTGPCAAAGLGRWGWWLLWWNGRCGLCSSGSFLFDFELVIEGEVKLEDVVWCPGVWGITWKFVVRVEAVVGVVHRDLVSSSIGDGCCSVGIRNRPINWKDGASGNTMSGRHAQKGEDRYVGAWFEGLV